MTVILWVVALMNIGGKSKGVSMPKSRGDNADSGPGTRWETPGLSEKLQKALHVLEFVDGGKTGKRLGCGSLGTVGARRNRLTRESEPPVVVCRGNSALAVEREVLRMGIELLAVLLLTEVSLFHFEMENSGRTVQYELDVQSLRLFGQHREM